MAMTLYPAGLLWSEPEPARRRRPLLVLLHGHGMDERTGYELLTRLQPALVVAADFLATQVTRGQRPGSVRLLCHSAAMLRGRLIAESLRIGADVEVPDVRVVRIGRHDVSGSTAPDQPDSGAKASGARTSGARPSGARTSGARTSGARTSGARTSGAKTSGATPDQPQIWTFLDFEAADDRADEVAHALAEALDSATGWYADFTVAGDHVVVFARRVFRYRIGDRSGREEAVAWGRQAGTPEHQLDWGD